MDESGKRVENFETVLHYIICIICIFLPQINPLTTSSSSAATSSSPVRRPVAQQHQASQCLNHTVVPFSIAIKRMSEILLYKANQCTKNLNRAADNVRQEMETLDNNADRVVDQVNTSFQVIFI